MLIAINISSSASLPPNHWPILPGGNPCKKNQVCICLDGRNELISQWKNSNISHFPGKYINTGPLYNITPFNCTVFFFGSLDSQFISTFNMRKLLWTTCRHPATSWEKFGRMIPAVRPAVSPKKHRNPLNWRLSQLNYPVVHVSREKTKQPPCWTWKINRISGYNPTYPCIFGHYGLTHLTPFITSSDFWWLGFPAHPQKETTPSNPAQFFENLFSK